MCTSLNKSCLSSFCTVKNFALGFATKTGTAAAFSITLVSNFVKRKAFPKRFCHNDNNNSGNMFRGIDTALTIFMMRQLTPSGFRFAAPGVDIASHTRFKAASLFTMFTVKQLQYKIVLLCTKVSSAEMYKKCSEVLSNIALLGHKLCGMLF